MTRLAKSAPALLSALLALSGCGTDRDFPSLARRPAELAVGGGQAATAPGRFGGSGQPAAAVGDATVTQQAVSPELSARLRQLEGAARDAHARFEAKRARTGALTAAARSAAPASEAWSVATVAIADLGTARSDTMVSLGELDRLYAQERIDGGDGGAIAAVRDQVTAWVADEDAVLAELAGRLKG